MREFFPLRGTVRARLLTCVGVIALAGAFVVRPGLDAQGARRSEHWVGTWATAVVSSDDRLPPLRRPLTGTGGRSGQAQPLPPLQNVHDQTLREIVHTSIGGSQVRVVLSNTFGMTPLTIGAAHIAGRAEGADITPGRPILFGGRTTITIPVGAPVVSDPVDLSIGAFTDVAVDIYVPGDTTGSLLTQHGGALQTSYVSEAGNHSGEAHFPLARTVSSWHFLSRLEVLAPADVSAIATLGDSITDGTASTPNMNRRWPNELARRLAAAHIPRAVLNLGIGGNRLLTDRLGVNALARFDRDVLAQSGVTDVIVLEGINDIGLAFDDVSPTAAEVIGAHQQLIARAHAHGLKIYGATLTPFDGAFYATPAGEAKRREVNTWIRTSAAYDGVIDFEKAVRDPQQPIRMAVGFDPGDHLHFNDAGYRAMAEAIDLNLFRQRAESR